MNATDHDGWTPLHYAARFGRADAAVQLLNAGANPNIADSEGGDAASLGIAQWAR